MSGLKELDLIEFEGLNTYDVNGYIAYYIPNHHLANKSGKVYQHMIAAEQMLGRELKQEEVVHHKDGNRSNNSFDNLIVFKTTSDHAAYHKGCNIELDGDVYVAIDKRERYGNTTKNKCPSCGQWKCYDAKLCLNCHNKKQAKNIPTKEELYDLLCKHNMCEIGRMFGVSDNAVRKWCKKYGLPYSHNDLKQLRK